MLVEASELIKKVSFFPCFFQLSRIFWGKIPTFSFNDHHKSMAMLTATRSRRLRRSCRAASRGRAATTPAKDPPILLSPITTPIATDGDPGEPPPAGVSSFAGRTITGRRHPAASVPASSRSSREHWALALEAARGGQCLGGRRCQAKQRR